jgi:hypothetical protein
VGSPAGIGLRSSSIVTRTPSRSAVAINPRFAGCVGADVGSVDGFDAALVAGDAVGGPTDGTGGSTDGALDTHASTRLTIRTNAAHPARIGDPPLVARRSGYSPITDQMKPIMMKKPLNIAISPIPPYGELAPS